MPGADVLVGVALDPRRKAEHQLHGRCQARRQFGQQFEVAPVIRHHGDAPFHRKGQLLAGFVVAVKHDPIGGHAAVEGREELSRRHRVQAQAL